MTGLKAAGALLAAVALVWFAHWNYERGRTEVLADWSASQVAAEQAVRQLESAWQDRVNNAGIQADEKLRDVSTTALAVTADNGRLRKAASAAAAKLAACKGSAGAEGSGGPGDMLTDVLSRAATRAGELAAYADRERIAREECQAAWPR